MSLDPATLAVCEKIQNNYSPCDVSDALLTLQVPLAGALHDITPIPSLQSSKNRIVAPISTVLFVPKSHKPGDPRPELGPVPETSNLVGSPTHWTDAASAGSIVLMQQPPDQIAALVGDIVATRYVVRGVRGVLVKGGVRDVVGCGTLCDKGAFTVWSSGLSSVGTSLEAKPWAVDVPLHLDGGLVVNAGDVLVADEGEKVACVIPRDRLAEVMELLPVLKEADDGVLADVKSGMGFKEAVMKWPNHYTNR